MLYSVIKLYMLLGVRTFGYRRRRDILQLDDKCARS